MKTASFVGTCPARSTKVLVTPRINHPYTLKKIVTTFPIGAINLMKLRFFMAIDDQAPATGAPTGTSILADYGQVDYVVGDGTKKELDHELEVRAAGSFLKVYAQNDDYYPHDIDVQMTIEQKERRP